MTVGHGKVRQTVGIPGSGISFTDIQSTQTPGSEIVPVAESISNSSAEAAESGWVTAGRILWKTIYWLTIGLFVAAAAILIGLLAGGGSSRHRR